MLRTYSMALPSSLAGNWLLTLLLFMGLLLGGAQSFSVLRPQSELRAQDDATPQSQAESGAGNASRIMTSASMGFVRRQRTDAWSVATINASNPSDQDGESLMALYFPDEPGRQFARRMWVPARARRTDWLPFFIPGRFAEGSEQITVRTLMIDASAGREVIRKRLGEMAAYEMPMARDTEAIKTAAYLRRPLPADVSTMTEPDRDALDTLVLARTTSSLSERVTQIESDFLPPWADVLRVYDNMLLCADRIAQDSAGQSALRAWIRTGGRLWISLDRVDPATLDLLLGNSVDLQVVDRVELDQFTLVTDDNPTVPPVEETCEFERPVELVRVATSAVDVPCRIDGWPAAIRVSYGEGEVLITTLAPRGWRREFEPTPTRALRTLAARHFQKREGRPSAGVFQPALEQRIGYRAPARSVAVGLLGGYCFALLGMGVFLWRTQRLDWLAWTTPALTLVAALVFVGLGRASSMSVPPTLAYGQTIYFLPQSNEARIEGLSAIYDQQSREVSWQSSGRGWLIPDSTDDASVRRTVWHDGDGMETQNATVNAGSVGFAREASVVEYPRRVSLQAKFGPQGLVGEFHAGDLKPIEDPVLLIPGGSPLAVSLSSAGQLLARPTDVLAADQYSADTLLSDRQRRRQDVMRRLFDPTDTLQFPSSPTLAFWTQPLAGASAFPQGFGADGEALGMLPVQLARTDAGAAFRVPASFLRMTTIAGRQGLSTAFDPRTSQWVRDLTRASEVAVRFQLPEQVLPAVLERGELTIRGNAPSRVIEVLSFDGETVRLVRELSNLNGVVSIPLDAAHLTLDARGGIRLALNVGETAGQRKRRESETSGNRAVVTDEVDNSTWNFDYVRLTVDGRTQE